MKGKGRGVYSFPLSVPSPATTRCRPNTYQFIVIDFPVLDPGIIFSMLVLAQVVDPPPYTLPSPPPTTHSLVDHFRTSIRDFEGFDESTRSEQTAVDGCE